MMVFGNLAKTPRTIYSAFVRLSSSTSLQKVRRPILPALRFPPSQHHKKKRPQPLMPDRGRWSVVGYSTAEAYDLVTLSEKLEEQGLYQVEHLVDELLPVCLYARAKYNVDENDGGGGASVYSKDIFFFENGSLVFWNVPDLERDNVLTFVKPIETDSYGEDTIREESELMTYKFTEGNTSLKAGEILLSWEDSALDKYAFSNGMAASVKLGALEASLDRVVDSIEHVSEDLKRGMRVKLTRAEVLQKTGELFVLRHVLNLSSNLLDTPDFYWDREDLERLYASTCAHLTLGKRTRVLNEKLSHCCELMDLVTNHLNDEHHVRLEWFIIILILIEVIFELLHFMERYV